MHQNSNSNTKKVLLTIGGTYCNCLEQTDMLSLNVPFTLKNPLFCTFNKLLVLLGCGALDALSLNIFDSYLLYPLPRVNWAAWIFLTICIYVWIIASMMANIEQFLHHFSGQLNFMQEGRGRIINYFFFSIIPPFPENGLWQSSE